MKEQLYTIPVNDAFDKDCECPICAMRKVLETNAVEYTMGPSYMEDDVRMNTDKMGFCREHMNMLLLQKNKLGLALILKTHIDHTNKEIQKLTQKPIKAGSLFKKAAENPVFDYTEKLTHSCFICDRINHTFDRYIHTVLQLWKTDEAFRNKYASSKGFCTEHFGVLVKAAQGSLKGSQLDEFLKVTTKLYLDNMQRLADDLEWFTDKFDYRYKDAPWCNSKDAIPRAVIKTNGILEDEDEKKTQSSI